MAEYIRKGSKMLCPNCLKGRLMHPVNKNSKDTHCDYCGQKFTFTNNDETTVKYK